MGHVRVTAAIRPREQGGSRGCGKRGDGPGQRLPLSPRSDGQHRLPTQGDLRSSAGNPESSPNSFKAEQGSDQEVLGEAPSGGAGELGEAGHGLHGHDEGDRFGVAEKHSRVGERALQHADHRAACGCATSALGGLAVADGRLGLLRGVRQPFDPPQRQLHHARFADLGDDQAPVIPTRCPAKSWTRGPSTNPRDGPNPSSCTPSHCTRWARPEGVHLTGPLRSSKLDP